MARDRAANKPDITPPIMMNCFANISRVSLISFTQKPAALSWIPGCVRAIRASKLAIIFDLDAPDHSVCDWCASRGWCSVHTILCFQMSSNCIFPNKSGTHEHLSHWETFWPQCSCDSCGTFFHFQLPSAGLFWEWSMHPLDRFGLQSTSRPVATAMCHQCSPWLRSFFRRMSLVLILGQLTTPERVHPPDSLREAPQAPFQHLAGHHPRILMSFPPRVERRVRTPSPLRDAPQASRGVHTPGLAWDVPLPSFRY